MTAEGVELLRAESTLAKLAARATEVKTRKAARLCVKELLQQTENHIGILAPFEGTDNVVAIATEALIWACIDERPLFAAPVEDGDAYSQRIHARQNNLPRALDILTRVKAD